MANINDSDLANVHRFRDRVAISVGDGSTFYLTHDQAAELGRILEKAAGDVATCKFTNSSFGSQYILIGGKES